MTLVNILSILIPALVGSSVLTTFVSKYFERKKGAAETEKLKVDVAEQNINLSIKMRDDAIKQYEIAKKLSDEMDTKYKDVVNQNELILRNSRDLERKIDELEAEVKKLANSLKEVSYDHGRAIERIKELEKILDNNNIDYPHYHIKIVERENTKREVTVDE